jgi:hypothetical protein
VPVAADLLPILRQFAEAGGRNVELSRQVVELHERLHEAERQARQREDAIRAEYDEKMKALREEMGARERASRPGWLGRIFGRG